jgi:hypothetical protein
MKKVAYTSLLILVVSALCCTSMAVAGLLGPEWPAPGGTTYTASGNPGSGGGLTFSYSGFNPSQYSQLYWGPWEGAVIGASLNGAGITGSEIMTFSSFTGNKAVWTGSSTWSYYSGSSHTDTISTRVTLTVNSTSFMDASAQGKGSIAVLAPVTGNYSANILFEANFFGNWLPVNDGYDRYQTPRDIQTQLEFSGGYYYTSVPVPGVFWLFGSGLIAVIGFRRRTRK